MNKCIYILICWFCIISCQQESQNKNHDDSLNAPFTLLEPSETGVEFINALTGTDSLNIIQYLYFYNGAGVGTGDFNKDGYADILFSSNMGSPELYLNNADGSLGFKNATQESGLDLISGWGTGVSIVDINNDGLLDVYLCQVGNYKSFTGKNRLLVNQGINEHGIPQFVDQIKEYGLDYTGLSTQAAFFDYDVDGDLDMYLLNHSVHRTSNYGKASLRNEFNDQYGDRLYENRDGYYYNVTKQAKIYGSRIGYGLGIAISDIDNNHFPDIYISNDFHEQDYLYLNQGNGTFKEVIKQSTGHTSQFSMGVDISDLNDDGLPDILSLDMRPEDPFTKLTTVSQDPNTIFNFKKSLGYHDQYPHNQLQMQQGLDEFGIPHFSEIASLVNMDATDWSWSALIEDFDNDSKKDIFISNGILQRPNDLDYLNYIADQQIQDEATDLELASKMQSGLVNNYFFMQRDNFQFSKTQIENDKGVSNGASYADFDLDGDLDLVTNNINQPAFIYENTSVNQYLQVKLEGSPKNRNAIGAKLTAITNGQQLYREINPTRGFMSSVDPLITIGLGANSSVDSLIIEWPDGQRQLLENSPANQTLSIKKSDGVLVSSPRKYSVPLLHQIKGSTIQFQHSENDDNEHYKENFYLQTYAREGPCQAIGDINGDNRPDLFFGNASGRPSSLFLSTSSQTYLSVESQGWAADADYEDVAASCADIDGDGDSDIIVGSHAVGLAKSSIRYYINDGTHSFVKRTEFSPIDNPSTIRVADFDQDGDIDYFVGSRHPSQSHSLKSNSSISAIMVNDGKGHFKPFNEALTTLGNVTDAAWVDIDSDGDSDLVIAAEWKPITILINQENGFSKREIDHSEGLWRSLAIADMDDDGDLDIVAGNVGTNHFIKASEAKPMSLNMLEPEQTGTSNLMIQYDEQQHLASIDELIKQVPQLKKQLSSNARFARWLISDSFSAQTRLVGQATELRSVIFKHDGQFNFTKQALPIEAQYSTSNAIVVADLNGDNRTDLIIGGNEMGFTSSFGNKDASYGLVLLQQADKTYRALSNTESGLFINGVIRSIQPIGNGQFIFGINNEQAKIYSLNQPSKQ